MKFNEKQNWNDHIYGKSGLISSLNQRIFLIRRLKQVINKDALIKIADSLFMSKVRYGLQLLGKVRISEQDPSCKELDDIQLAQNRLVRILNGQKLADRIMTRDLLKNVNIASINQTHAQIKILEILKSFKDDQANVLKIVKVKSYEQGSKTLSGSALTLTEHKTTFLSSKTFKNDAIKLWNGISDSIKQCDSIYSAKSAIKAYSLTLPL